MSYVSGLVYRDGMGWERIGEERCSMTPWLRTIRSLLNISLADDLESYFLMVSSI